VDLVVQRERSPASSVPTAAGKTTLFNCVSGLIPPQRGRIVFDGRDVTGWRADRVTQAGLVRTFQIARGFPRLSVLENLLLYGARQAGRAARAGPPPHAGRAPPRARAARARVPRFARRLNLARVVNDAAADLSGGQKKLLELGRALMTEPKLILSTSRSPA